MGPITPPSRKKDIDYLKIPVIDPMGVQNFIGDSWRFIAGGALHSGKRVITGKRKRIFVYSLILQDRNRSYQKGVGLTFGKGEYL